MLSTRRIAKVRMELKHSHSKFTLLIPSPRCPATGAVTQTVAIKVLKAITSTTIAIIPAGAKVHICPGF